MPDFIIKTHRKDAVYKGNSIYILNKGLNSGKPQKEPFTNSFVILFQNEEDTETVYWLAYSLWKANFWHQSLIGSVIPFLRIHEFKKEFNSKVKSMLQEHEEHLKQVQALRLLERQENQFQKNIFLINEMRKVILSRYCKKWNVREDYYSNVLNKKSLIQTNQASLINPEKVTNHNRTIYVSILSTILKGVKH